MKDLLGDLRELAYHKNPHAAEKMTQGTSAVFRRGHLDIEAQMGIAAKGDDDGRTKFMDEYFARIESVRKSIADICTAVESIKGLRKRSSMATSPEMEKEVSSNLTKLLDGANRLVLHTKSELEELKEENSNFSLKHPNSSESRIRDNVHQALARKFREVLMEYQSIQTDYKQDVKDKVARQVKIVYPEASEQELQQIVDEGGAEMAQLVKAKITGVEAHESLKNALSDLQDKYRDILRLEKNVAELHQMFVDLATLVDAQGELLDQIEFSVNSAKDYTEKAEKELVSARQHQKSAQKRMCWLSVCLIILAICIMLPLVVILTK